MYYNTVGQKSLSNAYIITITINLLSLVKLGQFGQLLLGIFQENFLDTPAMSYRMGQNFKLPFMIRKLNHSF